MRSDMQGRALALRFDSAETAARAAQCLREAGVTRIESYGPHPSDELDRAVNGDRRSILPLLALVSGLIGGALGYALQAYTAIAQYALDVGGRPLHSWPAFIPATFELTVLF